MRMLLMTAAAACLALPAPGRAAESALDKYLPESATLYVHIKTKNLFTAEVVRKSLPMVFDKYGDELMGLMQLAKQFNPMAQNIPEEQIKEGLKKLKDPKVIAQGFDAAKDFAPDLVIAGDPDGDPEAMVFLIKADEAITSEAAEGVIQLINAASGGQVKISKVGKGKPVIFEMSFQQAPISIFASIPDPGVIVIGAKRDAVEASAKGKGSKIDADLKTLIGKRSDKDFLFVAGLKGKGDERETMIGNLVLDKDVSGKLTATAANAEKAKDWAIKANDGVEEAVSKLKELLGDGAKTLKGELEKIKAKQDGKTVTLEGKIPGAVFEKLLSKD